MQNVLNHTDRSPDLTGKQKKVINCQGRSVRVGYYTASSYDVIRDVFVLFTFA